MCNVLTYLVAAYCCPVWINRNHTHLINTQLNNGMSSLTGTIMRTPTQLLPVLSNITGPHLRRKTPLAREWKTYVENDKLTMHDDYKNFTDRLESKKAPVVIADISWRLSIIITATLTILLLTR